MRYVFDEFVLCSRSFSIARAQHRLSVEPRVFDLVLYLMENRHRVVTKLELLSAVWAGSRVCNSALTRCVCLARRTFLPLSPIRTVHTRGYQWTTQLWCGDDWLPGGESSRLAPDNSRDELAQARRRQPRVG